VSPPRLRYASSISAFIFAVAFYINLDHGDLCGGGSQSSLVRVGMWMLVTFFGVSTLANIFSRSRWERLIMARVGLVLTVYCVIVALAGSS